MIIWINGSFCSGKTSVSVELNKLIDNSYIYDPEELGFLIRDNIPNELKLDDFQDYNIWRELNYKLIKFIVNEYSGTVIIPMTIYNKNYLSEIIDKLRNENIDIKHFTLIAHKKTLFERLNNRGDENNEWIRSRLHKCELMFNDEDFEGKIDTNDISVEKIANRIFTKCFE